MLAVLLSVLLLGGPCWAVTLVGGRASEQVGVSPVQQVLGLLTDLEAKVKSSGSKEENAYKKFADWCRGGTKDKEYEIKTAKSNLEDLSATIDKAEADLTTGSARISDLAGALSGNDADLKAATELRKKEEADFLAAEKELIDAVDTLDRAINILERKMKDSALLQSKVDTSDVKKLVQTLGVVIDAAALSLHDKQKLLALAQNRANSDDEDEELGAPAAAAYKGHSVGIVEVLEDMREKAEAQLGELRKEEVNAKHNYEMTKQSVEDQMSADNKDMSETKAAASSAAEAKATASGDLAVTTKDLKDAEESLELMSSSCMSAAGDHDSSMKAREEELKALAAAKDSLTQNTAGAAQASYGAASFLQLDSHGQGAEAETLRMSTRADLQNFEVVNLVRRLARQEHSPALTQLAGQIASAIKLGTATGADPFEKVKALIVDMLRKLESEAGSEASHKAYCDKEMSGTKEKLDDLTSTLDALRAKVDKKRSGSVNLKNEVQELQAELAQIAHSQVELDGVRREESKAYVETKADLEQGLRGVRQAMVVLREYYTQSASGDASSLIQKRKQDPEMPEFHSKSEGASTGIIGMLEVIESDFGKSMAQGEMGEDTAATEYEKISMQNKISKITKEKDVEYKTREATDLDKQVGELSSDGESAQTELDAVLEYSKTIRGQCELKPESYEERKGRREAEVSGLREALSILEGEAVLLQRPRKILRALRGLGH